MTIEDFTNKADGLINDFSGGASDEKEFRDGILDLLLEVATPAIQVQAKVKPEIAEEELLNFKQKLYKAQANMLKGFKPKEHQVILDFIATISKEDLQR